MKRIGFYSLIAAAFFGVCAYVYFMLTGPHMKEQPHIRAYQYRMPLAPEGVIPVERDDKGVPAPGRASALQNPLPDTPENRALGKTYYAYYCVFCHGESGQGNGPVGNSYMPRPSDLHSGAVLKRSDGELLRAMLTGPGHDPVLPRVIPARHRWYLVLYTRVLGAGPVSREEAANPPHRADFGDRGLR